MAVNSDGNYKVNTFLNEGSTFPYIIEPDKLDIRGISILSTSITTDTFELGLEDGSTITVPVIPSGIWTGYTKHKIVSINTASTGFYMEVMERSY